MNKLIKFLITGVVIGIVDVIPMLLMKLTWDANISAFTMWVVISYLLYSNNQRCNQLIKSIVVAFLVLSPNAILIGWNNPVNLIQTQTIPVAVFRYINLKAFFLGWNFQIKY